MRTSYFLKNLASRVAIQLSTMLLNFAVRTVFIYCLGKEYQGINSLFGSILMVLNLAELGIGTSIVFAMYRPAAENDAEKLKTLMNFYRRAYAVVGAVFLGVGLALLPVLPRLAKGSTELVDLRLVYVLCLLETTCSYWFYAHKGAILNAAQKTYLVTGINLWVAGVKAALQIGALYFLRADPPVSYYAYCVAGIVTNILHNLAVKRRVDREYPFLREKDVRPLPREERSAIMKNVVGMATNRVCQVLNDGIDSTVISALIGVVVTGVYSNYLMLKNMVNKCLYMVFSSLHSSVGNLCAVESTERKEEFFHVLHFVYFWLYGWCAICLWILCEPFIAGVWLHDESWLMSGGIVSLMVFNFLIEGLAGAVIKYRDVNGLYWQTRYRYLFSSVLNAVLSIVLVGPMKMGVTGALLGTTVSLIVMLSFDPVLVYREVFHKKAGAFYLLYFRDLLLVAATAALVRAAVQPFAAYTVGNFLIKLLLCMLIPNGLWLLLFRKTAQFRYLWDKGMHLAGTLLRRGK